MSSQEITQEEFEQIEAYLNHSLSDQDMVSIEERIKNDIAFKQKFEDNLYYLLICCTFLLIYVNFLKECNYLL